MDENTYKRFFEASNELFCVADLDCYFLELNPAWERVLGWSVDELRSVPYTDFVHPDDLDLTQAEANRYRQEMYGCIGFRNRYRHKNGSYRWLNWSCQRANGENHIYGIATDITDQVRDDLISRHCQALTNAGGWEYDVASDQLYWSEQIYAIFGVDPKVFKATSSNSNDFFTVDVQDFIRRKYQDLIENSVPYDIEVPFIKTNGDHGWIHVIAKAVELNGRAKKVYGSICDITARKVSELDHKKRELFLSTVLDHLPLALFCKDYENEGRYTVWNRMAEKLWGMPSSLVIGSRDADVLPFDVASRFREEDDAVFAKQASYTYENEWPFLEHDRNIITRTVKFPIKGLTSQRGMIIGITQEITEQKQAEKLLRAREHEALVAKNRLELAIAATGIGVWDWSLESGFINIDDKMKRLYGIGDEPPDIVRKKLALGVHPEDFPGLQNGLDHAIANRQLFDFEFRLSKQAGAGRYMKVMAKALYKDDGTPERVVGVILDITQSKMREIALVEQKEKLQKIVDNIPVMMAFVTPTGEVEWVNPEWQSVLGQTPSHNSAAMLNALFPNPKDRLSALRLFRKSTKEWFDLPIQVPGGDTLFVRWASVRLSSNHIVIIGQDITLRKMQERLIEEQRVKMLDGAKMSALGEMAGNIAHEINNPLAIIRGASDLLEDILTSNDHNTEQKIKILQKIQKTVVRVDGIVKGLLAFSRDGDADLMAVTSISDIITDTLNFCVTKLTYQKIKLTFDQPQAKIYVYCKAVQISQVILNLLNNATDAIDQDVGGWIKVDVTSTNQVVRVAITDSGIGVPQNITHKIMEPFFTTKASGKGSGLGLSISKQIIDAHEGRIYLDTSSSEGTRFIFELPMVSDPLVMRAREHDLSF